MYREVTMLEVKEVLRLWRTGMPTKRIAAQLGLDPKTVRRYLRAAAAAGLRAEGTAVTDDEVREVLLALQPVSGRPRGDGWAQCETQREAIRRWLTDGLRLTKIRKLLLRVGRLADAAVATRTAAVSRVDFHGGALAASLRLSDV